jgi:hypothetical protein
MSKQIWTWLVVELCVCLWFAHWELSVIGTLEFGLHLSLL